MDPITISGLAFTALTAGLIAKLNLTRHRVPRTGAWLRPPTVLIERGAPVTLLEAKAAMEVFEDLGFTFGPARVSNILGSFVQGAIVVGIRDQLYTESHAGETRVNIDNGFIQSARIMLPDLRRIEKDDGSLLRPDERAKILAHEFGHSIGLGHVETPVFGLTPKGKPRFGVVGRKSRHLMHDHVDGLGWDTTGILDPAEDRRRKKAANKAKREVREARRAARKAEK